MKVERDPMDHRRDRPRTTGPNDDPPITSAELAQLRVRVIALENLVITLLVETSERQLILAREMAAYISPRPGATHHH